MIATLFARAMLMMCTAFGAAAAVKPAQAMLCNRSACCHHSVVLMKQSKRNKANAGSTYWTAPAAELQPGLLEDAQNVWMVLMDVAGDTDLRTGAGGRGPAPRTGAPAARPAQPSMVAAAAATLPTPCLAAAAPGNAPNNALHTNSCRTSAQLVQCIYGQMHVHFGTATGSGRKTVARRTSV